MGSRARAFAVGRTALRWAFRSEKGGHDVIIVIATSTRIAIICIGIVAVIVISVIVIIVTVIATIIVTVTAINITTIFTFNMPSAVSLVE